MTAIAIVWTMDILSDISAIQNRIAEISGAPPAGAVITAPPGGDFNAVLAQALMPELAPTDTENPDAPAPVPPSRSTSSCSRTPTSGRSIPR